MLNLNLPKQWSQVTIEQFIEIRSLNIEDGTLQYNTDVLSILSDLPIEDFDDIELDELQELTKQLAWMTSEPSKRYQHQLDELKLKPFVDITLGEFITLEGFVTDDYIKNLRNICAILYRKTSIDEWGNVITEPYKFKSSERAHLFDDYPITSVFGLIPEYLQFRQNFLDSHSNLMTESFEDDEESTDPEERKEQEEEKKSSKWGWEQLIWSMCNGDLSKFEAITDTKLILIFNFLAMRKELEI